MKEHKRKKTIHFRGLLVMTLLAMSASAVTAEEANLTLQGGTPLNEIQINMWKDPAFQKQFTESYIAETEIEPKITAEEREAMQKVLTLIASEQMDEAALLLEKSRNDASSAVFDFTLANIYFQQEQMDLAVNAYALAVQKYPKFRRAWKNLALIHVRQGNLEKALPALTKVIELGGADSVTYGLLGYAYSSKENNLSAESAYRMAILLDPATMDWKMGLAQSLFKQQRFAEAAALCGDLIAANPDRADLWLLQANAFIGLNQPLKAAKNYEIVNKLGRSTFESLSMLADIYTNEELFDLAVNSYILALKIDPKAEAARSIRAAKILTARGAFKETKQLIDGIEGIKKDQLSKEEQKDLLKMRARLAVAQGSGDEKEAEVLKKIVELDPLDGEALILLGQYSNRSGDTEQAIFYFERAQGIEKFEADAKLRHAQVLVGKGKYEEALPLLERVQDLKPRDEVQKYIEQIERIAKAR